MLKYKYIFKLINSTLFYHNFKHFKTRTIKARVSYQYGVPGEIRTPDPRLRRALLYPAELLRHICSNEQINYTTNIFFIQ